MARSHLTLAALATSAIDGLVVSEAASFGSGTHGDFDSAVLTSADGRHFIVRVPTSDRAEAEQSADLLALQTLTIGVRGRLPFDVSRLAGQVAVDGTRAVVYEFVYGDKVRLTGLQGSEGLAPSIGRAIAAIHMLPTSFIADAGMPVHGVQDVLRATTTLVDRASATGLVPAELLARWEKATEDAALWQFAPTVINGALTAESFLSSGDDVAGVIGWQGLCVDDPAKDLFWLLGASDPSAAEAALDAYQASRGSSDRQIAQRARLYSELELVKWLLHGKQERSTEIVDDAVSMLRGLVDRVSSDFSQNIAHNTMPVMAVEEVEAMLDERDRRDEQR